MTLKIHIYQDKYPPEISSPPDEESCETAIRSLIGALIYTVKSDIILVLEFYSTCAIFDLCQSTCYIETEISMLNLSQSDSGFQKSAPRFAHFEETDAECAPNEIGRAHV